MTQVPQTATGPLRLGELPVDVRRQLESAVLRNEPQVRMRTIDELVRLVKSWFPRLDVAADRLPRDWRVNEIDPGTPYAGESTEMIPPGVYLAAGFTGDPEDGPGLILKVEQVSGRGDEDPDMVGVARQIADRLNGGVR